MLTINSKDLCWALWNPTRNTSHKSPYIHYPLLSVTVQNSRSSLGFALDFINFNFFLRKPVKSLIEIHINYLKHVSLVNPIYPHHSIKLVRHVCFHDIPWSIPTALSQSWED